MWTNTRRPYFVDQAMEHSTDGVVTGRYDGFQLSSVFQPIVAADGDTMSVTGYEALVRVVKGDEHISPPAFFERVPAEDRFFIDWLCRAIHISNFSAQKQDDSRIYVNLDPSCLIDVERSVREIPILIEKMINLNMTPEDVVFEIIETPASDIASLTSVVAAMRESGFGVAIDDFGVLQSDMERVTSLRPNVVKLDHNWCRSMMAKPADNDILLGIIGKFVDQKIDVLFEGVETRDDLAFIQQNNIPLMQGYLLGRSAATLTSIGTHSI